MKQISIENITKTYGEKTLFQNISFTISERERIGLIGVNGTGKSSLLKIVAGVDQPDQGAIVKAKDYKIAYLPQAPELNGDLTVLEQVFAGDAPVLSVVRDYENVLEQLNKSPEDEKLQNRLFDLQKKMDEMDGWTVDTNGKTILTKLGIEKFHMKINELSGGLKKRVALAQVLMQEADLLILDEPTNHLDYESIQWLEGYLNRWNGAVLLVTHDRYFLDKVTNRILELDGGSLFSYTGNYQAFLEGKAIREETEKRTMEKKKNLFRRELEWIRRGARARTTKQKARIERFEKLTDDLANVKEQGELDLTLGSSRLGKQVFEIRNGYKSFHSRKILDDFNIIVRPKDRIGIVGKNGSGKSTLLNILAKELPLDDGQFIMGQTVKIGYYQQENEEMNENLRVIEYIKEEAQMVTTSDGKNISASQLLERFLFPPYMHGTIIRKLSGGEKRRLYLLKILMGNPNVLLLDEPTNDLDTQTLTVLEDYLDEFPGVVITVSHDRYFLDKVVDKLLILHGDGVIDTYYGAYTDYLEQSVKEKNSAEKMIDKQKEVSKPKKEKKKRMTYKEKLEWENIEDEIEAIETKLEEIHKELEKTGSDYERAQQLMEEEGKLNEKLEYLIERWTYLSELV